jgi:hypothetical protein
MIQYFFSRRWDPIGAAFLCDLCERPSGLCARLTAID